MKGALYTRLLYGWIVTFGRIHVSSFLDFVIVFFFQSLGEILYTPSALKSSHLFNNYASFFFF